MTVLPRSLLYVPAVKPDLFDKAHSGAADAIILDLEDAVPLQHKETARRDVAEWLELREQDGAQIWVRVTPEFLAKDLEVAVRPGVTGIMIAKCSVDALDRADGLLRRFEKTSTAEELSVIGLLETANSLHSLPQMAQYDRVRTFGIGEVDLLADLRVRRTDATAGVIDGLRMNIVVACAAAGLDAPIAPTSTDFRDLDAFAETTAHFVDMGFRGRTAVHPGQIPVINAALTPSAEDVARARRLLDLFEAAHGGPTVDDDGRFVDEAVVRGAREVLARA